MVAHEITRVMVLIETWLPLGLDRIRSDPGVSVHHTPPRHDYVASKVRCEIPKIRLVCGLSERVKEVAESAGDQHPSGATEGARGRC